MFKLHVILFIISTMGSTFCIQRILKYTEYLKFAFDFWNLQMTQRDSVGSEWVDNFTY